MANQLPDAILKYVDGVDPNRVARMRERIGVAHIANPDVIDAANRELTKYTGELWRMMHVISVMYPDAWAAPHFNRGIQYNSLGEFIDMVHDNATRLRGEIRRVRTMYMIPNSTQPAPKRARVTPLPTLSSQPATQPSV